MPLKRETTFDDSQPNKKPKVHPLFDMNAKKAVKWVNALDSVLIAKSRGSEPARNKVAAFDLDGTLIETKSGRTFAKDEKDWRWWDPVVPKKIESLHKEGFKIVIFSNQNGLNSDKKINSFKFKVECILNGIDSPVLFLAAMKKDTYRKPMTSMWDWFVNNNDGLVIDKEASFYVGDAAGREQNWKPKYKKDHSCGDRKFAHNINIAFHTPEEFFLKEAKAKFIWNGFNPKEYLETTLPIHIPDTPLVSDKQEMIVCVGYPASGKSSFVKKNLVENGYTYINQDTLKTKEKCIKACKEALSLNQSVVIDNTNPEASTRSLYIKLAKEAEIPVRCFYFGDNEDLAQHNNYYRALYINKGKEPLSILAYRMFKSKFQEPTLKEGYTEVKRVHFKFEGNTEDKNAWSRWWVSV